MAKANVPERCTGKKTPRDPLAGSARCFLITDQFFRLWIGAGIRPPRAIKRAGDQVFSGITGPPPSRPPCRTT